MAQEPSKHGYGNSYAGIIFGVLAAMFALGVAAQLIGNYLTRGPEAPAPAAAPATAPAPAPAAPAPAAAPAPDASTAPAPEPAPAPQP